MKQFLHSLLIAISFHLISPAINGQCTTEVCDGIDNNCDGNVDEGFSGIYYRDNDVDGRGGEAVFTTSCDAAANGHLTTGGDCNDNDPGVWQSRVLYIDADNDGYHSGQEVRCFGNALPAGYDTVTLGIDCNDTSASSHTGAIEICDGVDNDCDGKVDEGFFRQYFIDNDHDGYGYAGVYTTTCDAAANGYATKEGDCNDANSSVWTYRVLFIDNDHDGYTAGSAAYVCYGDTIPPGYLLSAIGFDCDDSDPNTHPGAPEIFDSKDNDCDHFGDEGFVKPIASSDNDGDGRRVFYYSQHDRGQGDCNDNNPAVWNSKIVWIDADGDGYSSSLQFICYGNSIPAGFKTRTLGYDCDDSKSSVFQGAVEICDGIDNDCDGYVDEGYYYTTSFHWDSDGDGFGRDAAVYFSTCATIPPEYVTNVKDCFDGDSTRWRSELLYFDNDGDGYFSTTEWICYGTKIPAKYSKTTKGHDCNDNEVAAYSGAAEVCDGIDNDCDGVIDEDFYKTWYFDHDRDGYGSTAYFRAICQGDSNYVLKGGDCLDFDSTFNPGAEELCDGIDNDCDGAIDEDPVPPSITSITAAANYICIGSTTTLTANGVQGTAAVVTWWTGPGGTGTQVGTGKTMPGAGIDTFYARVTGSCGPPVERFFIVRPDTSRPVITCPAAIDTTTSATSCTRTMKVPNPVYSDNCAIALLTWKTTGATVLSSPSTGINKLGTQTFNKGLTTVTYTIRDTRGNQAKCSFDVIVRDIVRPNVSQTTGITDSVTTGCSRFIRVPVVTTADNCGTTTLTWSMTGATVASGAGQVGTASFNGGKTFVTYTVTDGSGNSKTSTFTVTILDKIAPSISCPADTTVHAAASCQKSITLPDPVYGDNCKIKTLRWSMSGATVAASPLNGINVVGTRNFKAGTTAVTYTVKDSSGNENTCTFNVTATTTGSCFTLASKGIGNDEKADRLEARLLPNPTRHSFRLMVKTGSDEPVDVSVYNSEGRKVYQTRSAAGQHVVFGESLAGGIYKVEVRQGDNRTTLNAIKQ